MAAVVMQAWRCEDVAAVASDIDARSETTTRIVRHRTAGMFEVEVHTVTGLHCEGLGDPAVLLYEFGEGAVAASAAVNVDHDKSADVTGSYGDIGIGPPLPPRLDLGGIRCSARKTVDESRVLAGRPARVRRARTSAAGG
jgi:hypothetical protein